jgi:hypothetical protein
MLKASLTGFALLVLAGATNRGVQLAPAAVPAGAGLGLLGPDLREEAMLGDAGANAMGAAMGYGAVLALTTGARWWLLIVLVGLNVASELVSFSRIIDGVAVLRRLDRWGSPHRHA